MPWDYRDSVAVSHTKHHRIFLMYDSRPMDEGFRHTGFFVDNGEEYLDTVLARLGRDVKPPAWYPEGAGLQGRLF